MGEVSYDPDFRIGSWCYGRFLFCAFFPFYERVTLAHTYQIKFVLTRNSCTGRDKR